MKMNTTKSNGARSGFTLLEILLAVAVFAIVLAAINSVYFSALRLRNKTTESIEAAVPLQRTVDLLRSDLLQLVPPGGSLSGPLKTSEQRSIPGFQNAVFVGPDFYTLSTRMDAMSPWAGIQRVNYLLVPSTNRLDSGYQLIRSAQPNLLSELEPAPDYEILMNGVLQMQYQYFDGTQWLDSWDSESEDTSLPYAIAIQFLHSNGSTNQVDQGTGLLVEMVVPIPVQDGIRESEETEAGGNS